MADPVVIAAYDAEWPRAFLRLAGRLEDALYDVAERVEHVGSTSVAGLPAKPILDIDVVVRSRDLIPAAIQRLESLGYRHQGDLGIPGREAFQSPPGRERHHLYVCSQDSGELARHLAFRDCLRDDAKTRRSYANLKQALAVRFRDDRVGYTQAKTTFVRASLERWWQDTIAVRPSTTVDAEFAEGWADAKRVEYEAYSPVFWRPAADARIRHRPFLEACLDSSGYTSLTALIQEQPVGVVLASHRVSAPLLEDAPGWLIDDFYVASPDLWHSVGVRLLEAAVAAARHAGCGRLVVVCGYRDAAKKEFLRYCGLSSAVVWWVKPIRPRVGPYGSIPMVVTHAPPVYDPGGLTALALREPVRVDQFEDAAGHAGAVLAIIPARSGNTALVQELREAGFTEASEWFIRTI